MKLKCLEIWVVFKAILCIRRGNESSKLIELFKNDFL